MPTRPSQGGSIGTWGTELNAWLDVGHNADGSNKTIKTAEMKIVDDTTVVTVGDNQLIFCIMPDWNGLNLVDADIFVSTVSSSGLVTVQLRNVTDAVDMLSVRMTIDANEKTSFTAATQPTIDLTHDDVVTGDIISVDVDGAGTGAKGLGVMLKFA